MTPHLQSLISNIPPHSLLDIRGADMQIRNGDVHYLFRQDSDFLYITGLSVPGLRLTSLDGEIILWREPITEMDQIWWHEKLEDGELTDLSWIRDIRHIDEYDEYIANINFNERFDHKPHIEDIRMKKDPSEIDKLREAIRVTKIAFAEVERWLIPWMYEYEIEAIIAWVFRRYHMTEGYPTIVASGPNACILHYTRHTRQIERGDLVLIDAGAEYMGYTADMTRTIIVWDMSLRQRVVIESVERVKEYAESILRPGLGLVEYESFVRANMTRELENLGLIDPSFSQDEKNFLSRKYYPHRTSHFLWLDVHDVGSRDTILEPNMVITVEPGIYIRDEGIGVRIEDDILVTESGRKNLSKD
jgi:Xaa-Pro aminopeptidase